MKSPRSVPDKLDTTPGGVALRHEQAQTALLLIDVINPLEFEAGDELLEQALPMAEHLRALKDRCAKEGIPSVYVNDNFGRWRSDFRAVVETVVAGNTRGRPVAERLMPAPDDYFVLKPRHSAFHATTLEILLRDLRVRTLILTGLQAHICVLFTAHDAHMRGHRLVVPRDCVASETASDRDYALSLLEHVTGARTAPSSEIDLEG